MTPQSISVCVIGVGVRGLCVLERIIAHARQRSVHHVKIHIVDPNPASPAQYSTDQPDYLLLNIVCGQVSMFPNASSVPNCAPTLGPDLYEWCTSRGLCIDRTNFFVSQAGRPIERGDFLPRRIYGEYLTWFYRLLQEHLPSSIEVVEHRTKAVDLHVHQGKNTVLLADGRHIDVDYAFVTVGQLSNPPTQKRSSGSHRIVETPYPLPQQVSGVSPNQTIAVAGLGLSAVDAILSLTVGRGGQFNKERSLIEYIPTAVLNLT